MISFRNSFLLRMLFIIFLSPSGVFFRFLPHFFQNFLFTAPIKRKSEFIHINYRLVKRYAFPAQPGHPLFQGGKLICPVRIFGDCQNIPHFFQPFVGIKFHGFCLLHQAGKFFLIPLFVKDSVFFPNICFHIQIHGGLVPQGRCHITKIKRRLFAQRHASGYLRCQMLVYNRGLNNLCGLIVRQAGNVQRFCQLIRPLAHVVKSLQLLRVRPFGSHCFQRRQCLIFNRQTAVVLPVTGKVNAADVIHLFQIIGQSLRV